MIDRCESSLELLGPALLPLEHHGESRESEEGKAQAEEHQGQDQPQDGLQASHPANGQGAQEGGQGCRSKLPYSCPGEVLLCRGMVRKRLYQKDRRQGRTHAFVIVRVVGCIGRLSATDMQDVVCVVLLLYRYYSSVMVMMNMVHLTACAKRSEYGNNDVCYASLLRSWRYPHA